MKEQSPEFQRYVQVETGECSGLWYQMRQIGQEASNERCAQNQKQVGGHLRFEQGLFQYCGWLCMQTEKDDEGCLKRDDN